MKNRLLYIIIWFILLFLTYFIFNFLDNFYYKDINQTIFISFGALIIPWFFSKFNVWIKKILFILLSVSILFFIFNIKNWDNWLEFNSIIGLSIYLLIVIAWIIEVLVKKIQINILSTKTKKDDYNPIFYYGLFISLIILPILYIIEQSLYLDINQLIIWIVWVDFFQFLNNFLFWILIWTIYEISTRIIKN